MQREEYLYYVITLKEDFNKILCQQSGVLYVFHNVSKSKEVLDNLEKGKYRIRKVSIKDEGWLEE